MLKHEAERYIQGSQLNFTPGKLQRKEFCEEMGRNNVDNSYRQCKSLYSLPCVQA